MSFVPCEWSEHEAVWLTWPSMDTWWSSARSEVLQSFANLASELSRAVLTRINCPLGAQAEALKLLNSARADLKNIEFFDHATNDVWCRDSGAIFKIGEGGLEAIDFKYNAWGGKFPPWDLDDALASKMAKAAGAKCERVENFICEGGALEFSADGILLTTDCVVQNPNRNRLPRGEVDDILLKATGCKKVLRLPDGLANDDTDGHIDNLARFTEAGVVLAALCGKDNPSCYQLGENFALLKDFTDLEGRPLQVLPLPLPDELVVLNGKIAPASYANYLVTNGAVFVPTFGQKRSDDRAMGIISEMFGGRSAVGIESRYFLMEGGTVHCLTQQQPLWKKAQTKPTRKS